MRRFIRHQNDHHPAAAGAENGQAGDMADAAARIAGVNRILTWNGTSNTNFATASNWTDFSTGLTATAAPGVNDEAVIYTSGTVSGTGMVNELGVNGLGAGMTLSARLTGTNSFVGGTVTMTSGSLLASGYLIEIGDPQTSGIVAKGPALLRVGAGATLDDTLAKAGALDVLVGQDGGTGTLDVSGIGALATAGTRGFGVGVNGTGTINVSAGGHITGGIGQIQQVGLAVGLSGGHGMVTLAGAGTGATFGDAVEIGLGGSGTLALSAGATLTAGDKINSLDIGDMRNSVFGTGAVSLDAASAHLLGLIEIGTAGQGNLTLAHGSVISTSVTATTGLGASWNVVLSDTAGSSGTLSVQSLSKITAGMGIAVGAVAHGELDVLGGTVTVTQAPAAGKLALEAGVNAGSTGLVNITGGSFHDMGLAGITIGGSGAGTLNVSAGGTLAGGALLLGQAAKSAGTVLVTGAGSVLAATGEVLVGASGSGSLTIAAGAVLTAGDNTTTPGLVVAANTGTGALSITGRAHATVLGEVQVGGVGSATLDVTTGSTLGVTSGSGPAMVLAGGAGSTAHVTVTDAGTKLSLTGGLVVGANAGASLVLANGATLVTSSPAGAGGSGFVLASAAGSSTALIIGAGTNLADTGQMLVGGKGGSGALTISAGATVTVANATGQTSPGAVIGAGTGSSSVTVTGSAPGQATLHSDWQIAGALDVGQAGRGALNVTAGGQVSAAGLIIGGGPASHGTVTVNGAGSHIGVGTLTVGSALNAAAGSLLLQNGGDIAVAGGANLLDGSATLAGGTLSCTGTLTVGAHASLTDAGTLSAGAIVDLGTIGVGSGSTLSCIGALAGTGRLAIGGGHLAIGGTIAKGVAIDFSGAGTLTTPGPIAGTIGGWQHGDLIDLTKIAAATGTVTGQVLSLFSASHQLLGTLTFTGSVATHNFAIGHDAGAGTDIIFHV